MRSQVIVAGHGGQGVLELGNYLCYFQLVRGNHVAFTPSYGPESRGGKVRCYVVASQEEIDSPIVDEPDTLIVMNIPSMAYVGMLRKGGTLLINSSLVDEPPKRYDVKSVRVPATEIAASIQAGTQGDLRDSSIAANSVMFGAYLSLEGYSPKEAEEVVKEVFSHFLVDRKAAYIPLNLEAVKRGFAYISQRKEEIPWPWEADA